MNILALVFSLILILSYAFLASWEKHNGFFYLQKTYFAHQKAQRKLLNRYQSEIYKQLRPLRRQTSKRSKEQKQNRAAPISKVNQECARINLWPLVSAGKEEKPALYELTAKLFRTLYAPLFPPNERAEYLFLDQILNAAKTASSTLEIEKLSLESQAFQHLFYKMLKGCKGPNEIPSLLDFVKFDAGDGKICLFHSHPALLSLIFGSKGADKLYAELHKENGPPLTVGLIEQICSESHLTSIDPSLIDLFELGRPNHSKVSEKTFVVEEDTVSLRAKLPIKKISEAK